MSERLSECAAGEATDGMATTAAAKATDGMTTTKAAAVAQAKYDSQVDSELDLKTTTLCFKNEAQFKEHFLRMVTKINFVQIVIETIYFYRLSRCYHTQCSSDL